MPIIEEWRELSKLLSTYLLPFPELLGDDGRLHTTFSQVTAATGRLSAQRPNLQNIPIRTPLGRELRATFVAAPGHRLLSVDYSQVELRILAHLSGEELLREAFERGEDIHAVTAAEVLGKAREDLSKDERNRAKAVNFGIIYGISAHGLSEQLEIARDEAQAYIDTYRGRMPLVAEFIERAIARRARARLRGHAARPPPADPRAARAELERPLAGRAPGRQHGHPGLGGRHHQARDGAHPPAAARGGPRRPPRAADPRRAAARGAGHGDDAPCASWWCEEMVGAYPLDPPLAVDSGIGDDWLAAKSLENQAVSTQPGAAGDRVARYNPHRKRRRAVRCRVESEETPYRYAPNER